MRHPSIKSANYEPVVFNAGHERDHPRVPCAATTLRRVARAGEANVSHNSACASTAHYDINVAGASTPA